MNIRKIALGGAAAVAFAGLLSAAPAYARTSHPATPEEMQQTDALNAQALAAAQGNPSAAPAATTATAAPQASPTTPVTTAAATPSAVEPPEGDTAAPATPAAPNASATAPVTTAAATPLTSMPTAPTLTNAAVQGSDGAAVGMVNKVIIGTDGKPASVNVALSDNSKVVAISATQLSFDSSKNILVASLTTEQIKSLPAASG